MSNQQKYELRYSTTLMDDLFCNFSAASDEEAVAKVPKVIQRLRDEHFTGGHMATAKELFRLGDSFMERKQILPRH